MTCYLINMYRSDGRSLTTKRIREIASDNKGNIWVGTEDDGINILDIASGQVNRLRLDDDDKRSHMVTLGMFVKGNQLFCGLFKQGLM